MKNEQEKERLVEQLRKTPIVQVACEKMGVGRATYYRWLKEDKGFAQKADDALREGSLLINDMAESQLISAIKDKNIAAIIYWLRHHHPAYTNRLEIDAHIKKVPDELTMEEEEMVREALRLASLSVPSLPFSNQNEENNQS